MSPGRSAGMSRGMSAGVNAGAMSGVDVRDRERSTASVTADARASDASGVVIAHVPVPFARSGDSVNNVVRALAEVHAARGGRTVVPLAASRDVSIEHTERLATDFRRYCP